VSLPAQLANALSTRSLHDTDALEEGKGQLWREVLHKLVTDKDDICDQCNWADHRSDSYRDILQAALAKNNSLCAITKIINSMQQEYIEYSDV
jgi:uncharacterized membrane protein YgaE (UPF0421/DUF939 family)